MLSIGGEGAVTRGHFRSRDKDVGHTVRSAMTENPMIHAKFHGSICYRTGVMVDRSSTMRE